MPDGHHLKYWEAKRAAYLSHYTHAAKDCEPVFHAAIIQCEVVISAINAMTNFEAFIPKLCDGKE